jgi:hypothetical protein
MHFARVPEFEIDVAAFKARLSNLTSAQAGNDLVNLDEAQRLASDVSAAWTQSSDEYLNVLGPVQGAEILRWAASRKYLLWEHEDIVWFKALPEIVDVYRGGGGSQASIAKGWSWTLSAEIAVQFSEASGGETILRGKAIRDEILLMNASQEEIVLLPGSVAEVNSLQIVDLPGIGRNRSIPYSELNVQVVIVGGSGDIPTEEFNGGEEWFSEEYFQIFDSISKKAVTARKFKSEGNAREYLERQKAEIAELVRVVDADDASDYLQQLVREVIKRGALGRLHWDVVERLLNDLTKLDVAWPFRAELPEVWGKVRFYRAETKRPPSPYSF